MHSYSKILVTGGAGFIGSHVVDRFLKEGLEVIVLDNLHSERLENVGHHFGEKSFRFVRGDIRGSRVVREVVQDANAVMLIRKDITVADWSDSQAGEFDIEVTRTFGLGILGSNAIAKMVNLKTSL